MKLLFVNGHLGIGGTEKSLVNLLKQIDYSGNQVDLLLFEGYGEYLEEIPKEVNIIFCDLTKSYGSFMKVIKDAIKKKDFNTIISRTAISLGGHVKGSCFAIMRLLKLTPEDYDCAVAYRPGFPAEYVAYSVKAKKKYLWWHHGEYYVPKNQENRMNQIISRMDRIIAVSKPVKKYLEQNLSSVRGKTVIIPNTIDIGIVTKLSKEFHPYHNNHSDTILVSVGRMSEEKHMIDAVYVMNQLRERGFDYVKWYLVGDGEERDIIESEIEKYGLKEKIICVGNRKNPYPYIADADVFVHPSHVESQGLTVLEAFALGKICVVTRSSGVESYVIDGKNAIIAEPTINDLTEKLISVLEGKYPNLFSDNQRAVLDNITPEKTVKRFMDLINDEM